MEATLAVIASKRLNVSLFIMFTVWSPKYALYPYSAITAQWLLE